MSTHNRFSVQALVRSISALPASASPLLQELKQQLQQVSLQCFSLLQRLRYLVRFYPHAMAASTLMLASVLGLLSTLVIQSTLAASKVSASPLLVQGTASRAGLHSLIRIKDIGQLNEQPNSGQLSEEAHSALAFLAQGLNETSLARSNASTVVMPTYGRNDPFRPLVKSTEEPPPVIVDPCEGISFIGLIQGDKKTPDVAILELVLPNSGGAPVTMVKPLGSYVEHNGFSLKLVKGNAHQLSVFVNGSTRTLALAPVVDSAPASATAGSSGAPDPNANPNLAGQPGGDTPQGLVKSLKE